MTFRQTRQWFVLKSALMKKQVNAKANYRLAVRLEGDRFTVGAEEREMVELQFVRAIRAIRNRKTSEDRRALAESVEWERLGDFRFATGRPTGAVRAYREAMISCLCGVEYDYGTGSFPCRWLRFRFYSLMDRATARCCGDRRLLRILVEHRLLCGEYGRMKCLDEFR